MRTEFIQRVLDELIVDTKKYRYVAKEVWTSAISGIQIKRIPIELLDTTGAVSGWENVKFIPDSHLHLIGGKMVYTKFN